MVKNILYNFPEKRLAKILKTWEDVYTSKNARNGICNKIIRR